MKTLFDGSEERIPETRTPVSRGTVTNPGYHASAQLYTNCFAEKGPMPSARLPGGHAPTFTTPAATPGPQGPIPFEIQERMRLPPGYLVKDMQEHPGKYATLPGHQ